MARSGLVLTRGRLPWSTDVVGFDAQGSEAPDSFAAAQRYADRLSPEKQVDRTAFVSAQGAGTFDNRKQSEPVAIGFPAVVAWNDTEEGIRVQATGTEARLFTDTPSTFSMGPGVNALIGVNLASTLALAGKRPSDWVTSGGTVPTWEYLGAGIFRNNEWDGTYHLNYLLELEVSAADVQLQLAWQYDGGGGYVDIDLGPQEQFSLLQAPHAYTGDLSAAHVAITKAQPQRVQLRRIGGAVAANVTVHRIVLNPYIAAF